MTTTVLVRCRRCAGHDHHEAAPVLARVNVTTDPPMVEVLRRSGRRSADEVQGLTDAMTEDEFVEQWLSFVGPLAHDDDLRRSVVDLSPLGSMVAGIALLAEDAEANGRRMYREHFAQAAANAGRATRSYFSIAPVVVEMECSRCGAKPREKASKLGRRARVALAVDGGELVA